MDTDKVKNTHPEYASEEERLEKILETKQRCISLLNGMPRKESRLWA